MPTIEVNTNVKVKHHDDFAKSLSELLSKLLDIPVANMNVVLNDEAPVYFGATTDPAYMARLYSVGGLNVESNKKFSNELSTFFENELGAPNNRGYIFFVNPGRENCGYIGSTLA
ncbi:7179_t:CDS:2 [Entrophospora sp. SA101]|nr:7276_t:CDS:2 [Entrophospora sp. SA101]CAJ0640991.1 3268_t:CDS:2 [Entrophospora sp. SA101]CAJ0762068.1 7179_t:CDS:2 [Entrophospora sp. SA101]CAJ0873915.1 4869_t:CDS:2 [Entrophospora sp. SA101]CAJ0891234.1 17826_t:CDS:2 [Entrophospora sp. SA101]